jgi:signal transduction histidine kinase
VRVLRDEQGLAGFEIPVAEIIQESVRRIRNHPSCHPSTRWETAHTEGPLLDNRNANLTLLIVENLGTNAAQALEVGGSIRIRADYREPNWEFVVEDDGPGLPPDLVPRLFTPMASTKTGGSGLGLAISRQLARHMGGDLDLVSSVPGCTRFRLRVPCPQPASRLQAVHGVTAP